MRQNSTLRAAGRARRVPDQRRIVGSGGIQRRWFRVRKVDLGVNDEHVGPGGCTQPPRALVAVDQRRSGARVVDDVRHLALPVGGVGRHDHDS